MAQIKHRKNASEKMYVNFGQEIIAGTVAVTRPG